MKGMSTLTISLITRNRSQFLKKGLFEMFEGIKENNLILNIFDNSSETDRETYKIYEELKKQYEKVFYYGTNKELSYPENCKRAFEKFNDSDYSLIIGDSNYISKENLEDILNILKTKRYDILVLNSGRVKDIKINKEYINKQEFFEELTWHCTLIGSTIYKKEFLETAINRGIYEKYTGNDFFQLGILLEGLYYKENCKAFFIQKKSLTPVKISKESYWRKNTFKTFGEDWIEFIEMLPQGLKNKEEVIKSHGIKSKLFTFSGFLKLRAQGILTRAELKTKKNLILNLTNLSFLKLSIIAFLPQKILKNLFLIIFEIRKKLRRFDERK